MPVESDGIGWMSYGFVPATFLFACYMAIHTQLTPGGGFQGGAIPGRCVCARLHGLTLFDLSSVRAACRS